VRRHFVFNNAGVGAGGLIWENSVQDWRWVLGVNLWGVIHGVRLFTPMMLEAAQKDPAYQGTSSIRPAWPVCSMHPIWAFTTSASTR